VPHYPAIDTLLRMPAAERKLGPFRLVEPLGKGGFAPVWLAREVYGATELRTAAIKLFALERAPLGSSSPDREEILAEARALCRVEHPNVVRFYSLAVDEQAGIMGLAMEHVAGTSLDAHLTKRGNLTVPEAIAVGQAMASALSAVHRAGLVHRDLKPANVVETAGSYKLIDFGIAAAEATATPSATRAGESVVCIDDLPFDVVGSRITTIRASDRSSEVKLGTTLAAGLRYGTLGYIDPYCLANGTPATAESDLYALGVLLFESLTGRLPAAAAMPRGGGLSGEVLDGRRAPPSLREIATHVPEAVGDLVDRLLSPSPADRPHSAEQVAFLLDRAGEELVGRTAHLPPESEGPFRGLGRFEQSDQDVYFGRRSEVVTAVETLRTRGVVALIGPSGSGKSSLARAGVLPAVERGALGRWPERWHLLVTAPGRDPRAAVHDALTPIVGDVGSSVEDVTLALAAHAHATGTGILLVLDQLEELSTMAQADSRRWTADLLRALGDKLIPGVRVLVTLRRDLLDSLLAVEDFGATLLRGAVLIEPMSDTAWSDALDQALGAYGYALEDAALKAEIRREIALSSGAMPLVQFALTELWHRRDTRTKTLTREALQAMGGLSGALARHADSTVQKLARRGPHGTEAAKEVLLALTTPQGTRASCALADIPETKGLPATDVLRELQEARLVVQGSSEVTLAHDALLSQWPTLATWVAEARADRMLAAELSRDAALWRADPEGTSLWSKRRQGLAEELLRRASGLLSEDTKEFVRAGTLAERRARWTATGAMAALLLIVVGSFLAYVKDAREQEAITTAALEKEQLSREKEQASRLKEQTSREEAERVTREVQAQQARIDELLAKMDDSGQKREIEALQASIATAPVSPATGGRKNDVTAGGRKSGIAAGVQGGPMKDEARDIKDIVGDPGDKRPPSDLSRTPPIRPAQTW
jgi:serine/threonine protein kinase